MNNINDGGPAYPELKIIQGGDPSKDERTPFTGMNLRDYFAGQALVGIITCENMNNETRIAELSYLQADALLKAREGK